MASILVKCPSCPSCQSELVYRHGKAAVASNAIAAEIATFVSNGSRSMKPTSPA